MLKEQKIELQGATQATLAFVTLDEWPPTRRRKEGLKYWGLCWLLAVFLVPVPLVHFVLVPLLLILGPALFYSHQKKKTQVVGGEGQCPECHGRVEFDKQNLQWPFKAVCQKNYDHLEVHQV